MRRVRATDAPSVRRQSANFGPISRTVEMSDIRVCPCFSGRTCDWGFLLNFGESLLRCGMVRAVNDLADDPDCDI